MRPTTWPSNFLTSVGNSDIGWEADKAGDTEKGDLFFALSDEATMVAIHSQVANPETAAAVLADIRKRAGL